MGSVKSQEMQTSRSIVRRDLIDAVPKKRPSEEHAPSMHVMSRVEYIEHQVEEEKLIAKGLTKRRSDDNKLEQLSQTDVDKAALSDDGKILPPKLERIQKQPSLVKSLGDLKPFGFN